MQHGFLLPSCVVNRSAPLNRGLVSWWLHLPNRIGGGGNKMRDIWGQNHGTLTNGPTWQGLTRPGGFGSISTVAASSQMVNCGTISNVNGTASCSLCGWLYRSATTETSAAGFSSGPSGGVGNGNRLSVIWFNDGKLYFSGTADGAFGSFALTGTGWHHIALVFDGSGANNAARIKMWNDGMQQTITFSETVTGTSLGTVTPFTLGRDSNNRYSGGAYDDWRVYPQTVLTDRQVFSIYQESCLGYHNELNWQRRPTVFDMGGGGGGGFNAAWAYRRSQVIGGGVL